MQESVRNKSVLSQAANLICCWRIAFPETRQNYHWTGAHGNEQVDALFLTIPPMRQSTTTIIHRSSSTSLSSSEPADLPAADRCPAIRAPTKVSLRSIVGVAQKQIKDMHISRLGCQHNHHRHHGCRISPMPPTCGVRLTGQGVSGVHASICSITCPTARRRDGASKLDWNDPTSDRPTLLALSNAAYPRRGSSKRPSQARIGNLTCMP